jgi:hypothetical protein
MVNILARRPLARRVRGARDVESTPIAEARAAGLVTFMARAEEKKLFGADLAGNEWERRLRTWPDLAQATVLSLRDQRGEIRAACVPWSSGGLKKLRVRRVRRWLRTTLFLPRLLGFPFPPEGGALETAYLTHLSFAPNAGPEERASAVATFVDAAKRIPWVRQSSLVSFADTQGLHLLAPLQPYLKQVTGVNLYAVTSADEAPPATFAGREISFEMALA